MPNANSVTSSNNQNNAIPIPSERILSMVNSFENRNRMRRINTQSMHIEPMHNRAQFGDFFRVQQNGTIVPREIMIHSREVVHHREIVDWGECEEIPMVNQESYKNRLRDDLANRQYPNQNAELLRFSEDDIDSDSDSDDGFPGLIDANGMPFDN